MHKHSLLRKILALVSEQPLSVYRKTHTCVFPGKWIVLWLIFASMRMLTMQQGSEAGVLYIGVQGYSKYLQKVQMTQDSVTASVRCPPSLESEVKPRSGYGCSFRQHQAENRVLSVLQKDQHLPLLSLNKSTSGMNSSHGGMNSPHLPLLTCQ